MLVILCGPTGVGRSSIIDVGRRVRGWRVVPWTTTRAARRHDPDRITCPTDQFLARRAAGEFFYDFEFFGWRYGIRHSDVRQAVRGDAISVTDLLPSSLIELPPVAATVVGVLAESDASLRRRISGAARSERAARAIQEQHLLRQLVDDPGGAVDHLVINRFGDPQVTAEAVVRLLEPQG